MPLRAACMYWAIMAVVLWTGQHAVGVQFDNNGYDLLVAIHRDVPDNLDIITQLQSMLTSASEYLYQTTRKYLYISHVTILVPDTWIRNTSWRQVDDITFSEADIRVDSPHPARGNNPYTFQPGQCGAAGRYIHLTPNFALDRGVKRDTNFGDAGRVIVHEFAHLRFGVFDEYGFRNNPQHPVHYLDDKSATLRPTACTSEITGNFVDVVRDLSCDVEDTKKLLSDDCDFLINRFSNKAIASVMYAQYLEEVKDFCEKDPMDKRLKHNADAPNLHNKMCSGTGTWDVISEHPDVKFSSPDVVVNRLPTFQIAYRKETDNGVRVCGRRLVLVLDVSASMVTENGQRYFRLRQMADKTIRDILPEGTEVGIVVFSTTARVWSDMTFLSSTSDRDRLAQGLPKRGDFSGSTAVGLGLLKSIELLKRKGKSAVEGRLFLITDGKELIQPNVKEVMSDIVREQVVVHTVAYSDAAADILRELSTITGGQYSYFDETSTSSALDGAAERLLSDISLCQEDDTVEIDRHAELLTSERGSYERTILIDSTVGNNTLFVFTLGKNATTEVELEDPSGVILTAASSYYNKDLTLNIVRYRIPLAQVGRWKYKLKKGPTIEESVVGVVKSHQRGSALPYEAESWISSTTFNYSTGSSVVAYTYVHQGYAPILHANVKLTASRPGQAPLNLTLKDDGILPDNTAGDGVYTNYLQGFRSNDRYSMEVRVESVAGETVIIISGNLLTGGVLAVYRNNSQPEILETLEVFTRIESVGAIDITGLDAKLDQLDPDRVTDLDLTILDKVNKHLTLTWTAPGDDLNVGTVTRYDLRLGKTFESLRKNFSKTEPINIGNVIDGSLNPLQAGSQQTVVIRLPSTWSHDFVVIGLKAYDEANRMSDLSNLKSITFKPISIPQRPPKPTGSNSSGTVLLWVAIVIGVVVISAIIIIVAVICVCKRRKPAKQVV